MRPHNFEPDKEGAVSCDGKAQDLLRSSLCLTDLVPQYTSYANNGANRSSTMGYEESVYLAKLAEQAERYEGT